MVLCVSNETGGEKATQESFPSLPAAGHVPKTHRLVLAQAHKHRCLQIYIYMTNIYIGTHTAFANTLAHLLSCSDICLVVDMYTASVRMGKVMSH